MTGNTKPDAMLGKPWREVSDSRDVAPVESVIREALKRHGKWFGTLTLHHRDGTVVLTEMAVTSMPDGGTICVSHDISQRISAQRERAETEIKYRTLIEQVAAISYIAELGTYGQWLYVSPQVESILGYSADEWLSSSKNWINHVHPDDHPIVNAAEESCQRGLPFQAEYRINRKDGEGIWVSDSAVGVRGSDSTPVMEGLIVDITDRKLLEDQLQQARKIEAEGQLAAGVSSEFTTLITIIKGYLEMALQRCLDPPGLHNRIRPIE